MNARLTMILAACAAGAILPLVAADGDILAESGDSPAFAVYTTDTAKYAAMSTAEIAALPPVFRRAGETVTATSPNGIETAIPSSSLASILTSGGVWTLAGSGYGETLARVGVAWAVYGETGDILASFDGGSYGVDSMLEGPNRKIKRGDVLPTAYSGDAWIGDASRASVLTFVSPSGAETTRNLFGTGASEFGFNNIGVWTVSLYSPFFGTTQEAEVAVSGGFFLIVR